MSVSEETDQLVFKDALFAQLKLRLCLDARVLANTHKLSNDCEVAFLHSSPLTCKRVIIKLHG